MINEDNGSIYYINMEVYTMFVQQDEQFFLLFYFLNFIM